MRKIFVVSLHRSATQSTDLFLRNAGLNTCHWPSIVDGICYELKCLEFETAPQKIVELLHPVFDAFDVLSDVPIPAIYEELDANYPDAKFIAVYRNPSDWVRSVRKITRSRNLEIYERVLYWRYMRNAPITLDDVPDDVLADLHRFHHEGLYRYFNSRDNFLRVDLMDSNIGKKLSSFLEIPSQEFPKFDYKMIPKPRFGPDHFHMLGKRFEDTIMKRDLVIADLHRDIDRLTQEYDNVYRFSLARIHNKVRRIIGARGST